MKIWHTVVALLILMALGGVLYYLNQQPEKSSGGFPKQDLFTFQPGQVEEFTIEMSGQPAATFHQVAASQPPAGTNGQQSEQPQWTIASPPGIAADSKEIQSFLEGLPNIKSIVLDLQSPASLAEYGLEQPQKIFKFKLKGEQDATLLIGKGNPNGFGRYAKLDSSTEIFLLDLMNANPLITKTLFDFRDRRILPVEMGQVQQLELDFSKFNQAPSRSKIVMTKKAEGNWQLTEPAVRTETGTTGELVKLIEASRIKSLEEENPTSLSRYGLASPVLRLEAKTPNGPYALMIGNQKNSEPEQSGELAVYYAKNSVWPHVFTIDEVVYSQLTQDLEKYRSRYLFDYSEAPETRRVEIQTADHVLRFDKKGEDWVNSQNPQQSIDSSKVSGFLNFVYALRIQDYTTDQPRQYAEYGLDKPWITIKIITGKENREEIILFGRKDDHFYAARQREASVYEMPPSELQNMESRLKELTS